MATAVYAEAEDSERVVAGEIRGASTHKLFSSFRHEPVDTGPVVG
jgi:hypothetical protein